MDSSNNSSSAQPILTETMAKLLLGQRHWRQAIDIYEELGQQNPEKSTIYQKEIAQIKEYFKPQANSVKNKKRLHTQQRISRLENLLKVVKREQSETCKQGDP